MCFDVETWLYAIVGCTTATASPRLTLNLEPWTLNPPNVSHHCPLIPPSSKVLPEPSNFRYLADSLRPYHLWVVDLSHKVDENIELNHIKSRRLSDWLVCCNFYWLKSVNLNLGTVCHLLSPFGQPVDLGKRPGLSYSIRPSKDLDYVNISKRLHYQQEYSNSLPLQKP